MKTRFTFVIIRLVLSLSSVAFLYVTSGMVNRRDNGFIRLYPPHPVMFLKNINIGYNSYYIAGGTRYNVYFGNYKAPLYGLAVNIASSDTLPFRLSLSEVDAARSKKVVVSVDSPNFYLMDGIRPALYKGI